MITFYYGSDAYRLREAVRELLVQQRAAHQDTTIVSHRLSDDGALPSIEQCFKYPSLLTLQQIIVVSDAIYDDQFIELLRTYHVDAMDGIHVVAVQEIDKKPNASSKKKIDAFGELATLSRTFDVLTASQQSAWMQSFCKQRNRRLERSGEQELLRRCGTDTWRLANELEKLCAYCDSVIDSAAVCLLVSEPPHEDQWEFSNAAARHDKRGMLVALFRHSYRGTPPPLLLGMIASAVRTVLSLRDLLDRGLPAPLIARTADVHPFIVKKHMRDLPHYNLQAIRKTHQSIAALDQSAKQGSHDTIDELYPILFDMD